MSSVSNHPTKPNRRVPIISVIVAVFNQERFIGRCLRSLLDQVMPLQDYEIIVVNDGSDDRTKYALELFCDPYDSVVRVITNETNRGLPASINLGLHASRAPYVIRVDSDDFVNTHFLSFLQFYLEANDCMDAVACDYLLIDDEERVLDRGNCVDDPIACGIMFRKEQLFDIGLYDESFRCHEERELRIRFEKKYKIHRLELPLYRYRRHDNNITNNCEDMGYHYHKLIAKHGTSSNT
jgi:glycosyltransferase involved in cell wall biosynthesis